MVTSAQFQLLSDWSRVIAVNINGEHLTSPFPTPLNAAPSLATPDPPIHIQADESLSQSWINFQFMGTELAINLGRIAFSAGVRSKDGPKGQSEVIIAPRDPGNPYGYDFYIWLLAGPGRLQAVFNSAIKANLAAILPTLKGAWYIVNVTDVIVDNLECTYAALSKQGRKSPWTANLVFSFTGSIVASITSTAEEAYTFTNLLVYVGITLDTRDSINKLQVRVNHLQVSVDHINGLPLSSPISYYLPGYINSTKNAEILKSLNEKLAALIPENIPPVSLEKYNLADHPKSPVSTSNFKEWMSRPSIQAKTFSQLKIPGTHDSAAYTFEKMLSQIIYDDMKFLNELHVEEAPTDKDLRKPPYHIGPEAYMYVMDQIAFLGQAHDESRTIHRQLEDGIRFFDLRIYFDTRQQDYYTQHCLRGPTLSVIINQIEVFIQQHASSQELMIFHFSHSQFENNRVEKVADLVRERLGPWLYLPPDSTPASRYDFQKFKDIRLSTITNGAPKVLFVNTDGCNYPHSILNISNEAPFLCTPDGAQPSDGLYEQSFTTVPTTEHCAGYVALNMFSQKPVKILQRFAYKANATVEEKLISNPAANCFMMDWYTETEGKLPVDLIIKAND